MLELSSIDAFYDGSQALNSVSLVVERGKVTCLLGRNGAGKSTTIFSIVGFVPTRRGTITFDGEEITRWSIEKRANRGLALVPQGRRVFPTLTAEENLLIGSRSKRGGWTLSRIYELFPQLSERRLSFAGRLSGGEQQMVAIGRALMMNPSLLLLDEPSEGLAPLVIEEVYRAVRKLAEGGMSILLAEHSLDLAISLASRIYILSKGSITWESQPNDLTDEVLSIHLGLGA